MLKWRNFAKSGHTDHNSHQGVVKGNFHCSPWIDFQRSSEGKTLLLEKKLKRGIQISKQLMQ